MQTEKGKIRYLKNETFENGREKLFRISTNFLNLQLELLDQNVYKNTDAFVIVIESFKNKFVKETHEETLWN
jgi:hypothetical protein